MSPMAKIALRARSASASCVILLTISMMPTWEHKVQVEVRFTNTRQSEESVVLWRIHFRIHVGAMLFREISKEAKILSPQGSEWKILTCNRWRSLAGPTFGFEMCKSPSASGTTRRSGSSPYLRHVIVSSAARM